MHRKRHLHLNQIGFFLRPFPSDIAEVVTRHLLMEPRNVGEKQLGYLGVIKTNCHPDVPIYAKHLLHKLEQEPIQLGGPGIIVQIDESLFRHKPKYHRGRPPRSEQWVFGMVDTSTSPATGYMELVEKRDAATLLPIINRIVRPGSIIHSDQWRAYNRISDTFQHEKVNHSENFVDPDTGVHTQNIESYWSKAKTRFKRMKGVAADQLESYLDEIMWRDRYGRTYEQAFANIKVQMAEQAQHN